MGRALMAVAAVMFLPATASARPPDCGPGAARTVQQSAAVRVFFVKTGSTRHYYACWRRTGGKPLQLVYNGVEAPTSVGRFLIRGRFLAFVYTDCQPECAYLEVSLVDVKRRRFVVFAKEAYGSIRTLVATRGGAAAFLAADGDGQYVERLDSLGITELDRGAGVRSLSLRGSHLHWLHGSQDRDDHIVNVRRCGPGTGAITQALSRRIRVYTIDPDHDDEGFVSYACLLGGGKPLLLGNDKEPFGYLDDFQLRGDHVVWLENRCPTDECVARIHSADLRGRTTRAGERFHTVPQVFPNRRGFAAELTVDYYTGPARYELLGFDSSGERVLDKGTGIDPDSIVIFDDAVTWRHDGDQRRAPLR
jgi:hypothetical protein